jgi:hypothetical protein
LRSNHTARFGPSEVSIRPLERRGVIPSLGLLCPSPPVQRANPAVVPPCWSGDPASPSGPFAPAVRSSEPRAASKCSYAFDERPLVELGWALKHCPAEPSSQAAARERLSWALFPSAHTTAKVHSFTGIPSPLRSALRVWIPSRRFSPFAILPVMFRTGRAHGIRPSELFPSVRYCRRFRRQEPTCRFALRYSCHRSGKPARRAAAPRLCPARKSLAYGCGISASAAGGSRGLGPSEVRQR